MSIADSPCMPQMHSLYTNHHPWLLGWLRRRLGDAFDAADIAHDTYLRLMQSGSALDEVQARPFLAQIARGLAVDLYRRRRIEAAYLDTLEHMVQQDIPSEETRAIIIDTLMLLDRIISGLAPKVRQAFLLRKLDELSYAEIGSRLGVTVSSVEKYMVTALTACYAARYE
jgi:RNA polymerase sigma factor (sigma-70 family)